MASFDLAVVGAGIVGLAHALAAARRGLRVVVLERDARAASASVQNFGFVTVSGQEERVTRPRALRSRETWLEVTEAAGIEVHQRGTSVIARRPEALRVLEEFAAGPMGAGCEIRDKALWSPHELRVEARDALPRLASWLEEHHGVVFAWGITVKSVDTGVVHHSAGELRADAIVVAPGVGMSAFAPEAAARVKLRICKLQMLRLADPGFRLPGVVMTDLSLLRYEGFAHQPSAAQLRARLEREYPRELEHGVHLIVAQARDGTLVVGDSHHYLAAPDAARSAAVDDLILAELKALLDVEPKVIDRWLGFYPVTDAGPMVSEPLAPRVRLVLASGTGMSTAFAIGEETTEALFG